MRDNRTANSSKFYIAALLAWLLLVGAVMPSSAQASERPADWTDASHGNRAPANYALVLPDEGINEIYISFSPASWADEAADMTEIYGERGNGAGGGRGRLGGGGLLQPNLSDLAERLGRSETDTRRAFARMPDFEAAAELLQMESDELLEALGLPQGFRPPAGGRGPGGQPPVGPGQGGALQLARNPIWVPVTIQFEGQTWTQVGFRYKGNSTLAMGWRSGTLGLPFKLDFDEFEDDHPELDNQRFHGFKQLSFANNALDPSLQREKVTADIFRAAGVPAAETAFYAVYVDQGGGDGFQYWGLYTAIELPDDTLIETQFADDNGNMYKPDGPGATFALKAFTEESFDKETNRDSSYEDVLAVFAALHDQTRLTDPAAWRAALDKVFDADGFLRWLASNTLLQNWDTYGNLPHNYYLYADAASGQLTWIPWDNNMALSSSIAAPSRYIDAAIRGASWLGRQINLSLDNIDVQAWPLIGFLMQDPVYAGRYVELLSEFSEQVFTPAAMTAIYEQNFQLLSDYIGEIEGEEAVAALRSATDELVAHAHERALAAQEFLNSQSVD